MRILGVNKKRLREVNITHDITYRSFRFNMWNFWYEVVERGKKSRSREKRRDDLERAVVWLYDNEEGRIFFFEKIR